jgi:hypothetical protein
LPLPYTDCDSFPGGWLVAHSFIHGGCDGQCDPISRQSKGTLEDCAHLLVCGMEGEYFVTRTYYLLYFACYGMERSSTYCTQALHTVSPPTTTFLRPSISSSCHLFVSTTVWPGKNDNDDSDNHLKRSEQYKEHRVIRSAPAHSCPHAQHPVAGPARQINRNAPHTPTARGLSLLNDGNLRHVREKNNSSSWNNFDDNDSNNNRADIDDDKYNHCDTWKIRVRQDKESEAGTHVY